MRYLSYQIGNKKLKNIFMHCVCKQASYSEEQMGGIYQKFKCAWPFF